MDTRITIRVQSLKSLLSLFDMNEKISKLTLGDTWHPSSGFIDESILNRKETVRDILDFPYDFKGLVHFEATIAGLTIKYIIPDIKGLIHFELTGKTYLVRKITNKIIELNTYFPNAYIVLNQQEVLN